MRVPISGGHFVEDFRAVNDGHFRDIDICLSGQGLHPLVEHNGAIAGCPGLHLEHTDEIDGEKSLSDAGRDVEEGFLETILHDGLDGGRLDVIGHDTKIERVFRIQWEYVILGHLDDLNIRNLVGKPLFLAEVSAEALSVGVFHDVGGDVVKAMPGRNEDGTGIENTLCILRTIRNDLHTSSCIDRLQWSSLRFLSEL